MQQGNARVTHDLCQIVRVLMATGTGHDQFGTGQKRQEKLPDRHVEPERGLLQHPILTVHFIGVARPEQAVDHAQVLVHHAFGRAGGTGGVQHIGQMIGLQAQDLGIRVAARLLSQLREVIAVIEHQHRNAKSWQICKQIVAGQHRTRGAVAEHIGLASTRQVRVNRHVGATGLEDTQQRHDHFRAATQAYCDPRIRFHAQFDQAMGELVGLLVEFGVSEQRPAVAAHSAGIRTPVDLLFDQLVNQHIARIRMGSIIETRQQQLALIVRQHRQAVQRCLRRVFQCFHEAAQCNLHVLADARCTDLFDGLNGEHEVIAQVIDVQAQRIVGPFLHAQGLNPLPG
ncbi:hypothetical protein ALP69_05481 [Pseudomonas syringae pv. aceris]|nr:hypothetical protein ALP69_05481 [Pseudomonas syringae pv. aceris]